MSGRSTSATVRPTQAAALAGAAAAGGRAACAGLDVVGLDHLAARQDDRAVEAVLELAHVAAPRQAAQRSSAAGTYRPLGQAVEPRELGGEVPCQGRDVLPAARAAAAAAG